MRVVCGLRNSGSEYTGTRHNLGFEVVARMAERHQSRLKRGPLRVRAEVAKVVPLDLILATPTTYMNDSGRAVKGLLSYFKADLGNLLVIHDDIDLDFGRLRIQVGGGSGGHNGIRSLEQHLGTKQFSRLKVGVGRPPGSREAADHVLRQMNRAERQEADLLTEDAVDVVELWLTDPDRAQEKAAHRHA